MHLIMGIFDNIILWDTLETEKHDRGNNPETPSGGILWKKDPVIYTFNTKINL